MNVIKNTEYLSRKTQIMTILPTASLCVKDFGNVLSVTA